MATAANSATGPAHRAGDWDTHLSVLEADEDGVTLQRYPLGE